MPMSDADDPLLSIGVFGRRCRLSMKALRLYDRLGVPRHDKVFYRLSGDNLKKFAAG